MASGVCPAIRPFLGAGGAGDFSDSEEPEQAVFRALVSLATDQSVRSVLPRVSLQAISNKLKGEGLHLNGWQVGKMLRDIGFETKNAGGTQYAYTGGISKLREVAQELGVQDEFLQESDGDDPGATGYEKGV